MTKEITKDMSLEDIIDAVDELIGINNENIDAEASRQTRIFTSLQKLYMWNTRKLETMVNEHEKVKAFRKKFYEGKLPSEHYKKEPLREAILKSDVEQYLKVDQVLLEAKARLTEQERIVKYLEDSKKMLSDRTYLLSTALNFQKMCAGG